MPRLIVEGHGAVDVDPGVSLLEACEDAGLPMDSDCGGCAACNACRVTVLDGADALTPQGLEEGPFLDAPDQRLGCQARLVGGIVRVRLDPGLA